MPRRAQRTTAVSLCSGDMAEAGFLEKGVPAMEKPWRVTGAPPTVPFREAARSIVAGKHCEFLSKGARHTLGPCLILNPCGSA